ncbi:MAG: hypothetical protein KGD66_02405 [Candidatus Lokiarchaeota archaeon]|nr:hypothetical protein [Candidatus Lokiarchaeota archaeon]
MLLNMFQINGGSSTGLIITYSIVAGATFLFMILFLKLGLASVKSKTKKGFKLLAISILIQLSMIALLASPFILMGFAAGEFDKEPSPVLIIFAIVLAIFMDLNIINILHKTGLKRAILCFFLMIIPLVAGSVVGVLLGRFNLIIPI